MEDLLAEYPVIVECPVIWGDMDAYQHVNNTVYFRYFETVRIAAEGDGLLMAFDYKGMCRASFPALVRERILEIACV